VRTAKEALEQSGNPHGISIKDLQVLAASECSEAMGGAEEELDGILKGTAQLVSNLKAARKQAGANFKFGCDQVNFSLRDNRILSTGVSGVVPENLKPASVPLCANHTHAKVVKPAVVTDDEFLVGPELLTQEGVTECRAGLLQEIRQVKGKGDKKVKPKAVHPPGRKQGDPLPVTFNISLLAPGITKKHEGVILRKGNSKLELMAQTDSSENGIYRFMGADQPLVQMEETGKTGGKALQDPTEPPPSDPEERPLTKEPDALIGGLADAESQVVAPPTLDPGQEVPETTSAPIPSPADAGGLSSGGESEKTV